MRFNTYLNLTLSYCSHGLSNSEKLAVAHSENEGQVNGLASREISLALVAVRVVEELGLLLFLSLLLKLVLLDLMSLNGNYNARLHKYFGNFVANTQGLRLASTESYHSRRELDHSSISTLHDDGKSSLDFGR